MTNHVFYSLIANRDLEQLNHKLAAYRQLAKDAVEVANDNLHWVDEDVVWLEEKQQAWLKEDEDAVEKLRTRLAELEEGAK